MKRGVLFLLAGLALAAGCSRSSRGTAANGFNVLLVTVDTTRADHIGAYGYKDAETPNIDALAARGTRFDHAISNVPLTLPSHASILSGLLPLHHGVRNNGITTFPKDKDTLATLLSRSGYRTGAFVGSFVLNRRFGLDRGFDVYDDDIDAQAFAASGLEAERSGDVVVDRALAWLGRSDARPFFAWVHLYDPHAPYAPPEPYRSRHAANPYDGEIAFTDAQIGRLLEFLEKSGQQKKTIVVVVGDHGEALGEHGELTHGLLLYEPTLRVPLIVSGVPGQHPGSAVADTVSLTDLAPTIAKVLGLTLPSNDGIQIASLTSSDAKPQPRDVYSETEYPTQFGWSALTALHRAAFKYIESSKPELYDLASDPSESRNLYETERRQTVALRSALLAVRNTAVAPSAPASMDEESRAKLASLGYVGGVAPSGNGPRPNPRDMVPLFRRFEESVWAISAHRYDEARAMLRELVATDANNPVFRTSLARVERQTGHVDEAVKLYRDAAAATPSDPDAWYNLAVTLQEAGRVKEALVAIREAIRHDDRRPEAHNTLGLALVAEGDAPGALAEFDRAIALDPKNATAFNNAGNVLRQLNRLDDAEAAYRKSAELAPRYADPLNGLGTLAVQRDRAADALPLFDRALAIAPDYHEVHLNRGIALELLGRRREAAAEYSRFIAEVKNKPEFTAQRQGAAQLLSQLQTNTSS